MNVRPDRRLTALRRRLLACHEQKGPGMGHLVAGKSVTYMTYGSEPRRVKPSLGGAVLVRQELRSLLARMLTSGITCKLEINASRGRLLLESGNCGHSSFGAASPSLAT